MFNLIAVAAVAAGCGGGGNPSNRNGGNGGHAGGNSTGGHGGIAGGGQAGTIGTGGIAGAGGVGGTAGSGTGGSAGTGGHAGAGGGSAGTGGTAGGGGTTDGGMAVVCPSTDAGTSSVIDPEHVVFFSGTVTVSTFAGGATDDLFENPVGVAIEQDGSLVVADYDNNVLDHVVSSTMVSILTQQQSFAYPGAVATNAGGTKLYAVTDANTQGHKDAAVGRMSSTIWSVTLPSGAATNVAVATGIGFIRGIGVLSDGRIAAADRTNHLVWLIDPSAGTKSVLAGSAGCIGGVNGSGAGADFNDPFGLAVLPDDSVVVADYVLRVVRRVTKTGVVTTLAGDGGPMGTVDGPGASARFVHPQAVAADGNGIVYVSDVGSHRIRRIDTAGNVTTLAGDGTAGAVDGAGNQAEFYGAEGLAVSSDGTTLYVADGTGGSDTPVNYHRIRKITIAP